MTYAELLFRYRKKHKRLVEPVQGSDSLHDSLWLAYSMGRKRGFTDLGTYVNKPGDHGWDDANRMAIAFDLGRKDRFLFKGWGYIKARRLAQLYVKYHKPLSINYVILGRRIWGPVQPASGNPADAKPYWHRLTTGDTSHDFHIHVSGVDPRAEV